MEELVLVEGLELTIGEVQEAQYFLADEYGLTIELWEKEQKNREIFNYWVDRGKVVITD